MPIDQPTNSRFHAKVEFPDEIKAEWRFVGRPLTDFSAPGPEDGTFEILKFIL